jgi:CHAD domain-containing protein
VSYRFQHDESVPESVRRIAREELDSTVGRLSQPRPAVRDEAIHEARKGVKKVRALLRLVQSVLGDSYRTEGRVLRKAGRTLSELRDASSVIEILNQLQEKYPRQLRQSVVVPIRRGLLDGKKRSEERRISRLFSTTSRRTSKDPANA